MELTQEYFDSVVKNLATKDDLKSFATKDDLTNLVTKDNLKASLAEQTKELKQFAVEQTEELARIIAGTVAEPMQNHFGEPVNHEDIKAKVQELAQDVVKIRTALHLPV
ncbi:MAG: hypothetical protein JNK33_02470 [Candidatus Doudnabacteria bacterium]|nr:hypothetical protein [Candidatus Doudnabacteria bacterium]